MIDREFCYRLNKNIELLVERFAEKYWDDMPTIHCVEGEDSGQLHYNYYFNDDMHFNADEMFVALWNNIPRCVLTSWWDIQCGNTSGPKMSLYNYYEYTRDGTINKAKGEIC